MGNQITQTYLLIHHRNILPFRKRFPETNHFRMWKQVSFTQQMSSLDPIHPEYIRWPIHKKNNGLYSITHNLGFRRTPPFILLRQMSLTFITIWWGLGCKNCLLTNAGIDTSQLSDPAVVSIF